MKRISFLVFVAILCIVTTSFAQVQKDPVLENKPQPPGQPEPQYKLHPELPAFNILLLDSATVFNTFDIPKGKPIVIMTFMPDCDHCQKLTEKLLKGMDTLKNIRFYLVSPMEIKDIKRFSEKYELSKYHNIVIGKDKDYFGPTFYQVRYVPFLALYDKDKQLIDVYEQTVEVKALADASKKKGKRSK